MDASLLKPQVRQYLEGLAAAGRRPPQEGTPEEAREGAAARRKLVGAGVPVARAEDLGIPVGHDAIGARLYVPEGVQASELRALILYFHGGGWVIGTLDDNDAVCRQLAHEARSAVLAVDYRLAPEHRFPAAVDDAYAALEFAAAEQRRLLGRELPIVLMGESAGGNLAAVTALRARDWSGPAVALQVLVYPVTDANFETGSYREFADGPFLTRDSMKWFWDQYVPDPDLRRLVAASPLRAARFDGLPPAIVITAEIDPLRDDGEAYAVALKQGGVKVCFRRFDGTIHSFFGLLNILDDALEAIRFVAAEMERFLASPTAATKPSAARVA
jgi:acetyl esterase